MSKISPVERAEKSLIESKKELAENGENSVKKSSEMMFKSFEDAIKLFIASIKYQDPMDPVDTSEMSKQMFQLSQAQGQHAMLEEQKELNNIMKSGQVLNSSHLFGQMIEVNADKFSLKDSTAVELGYVLPAGVAKTNVTIVDEKGRVIFEKIVEPKPGQKTMDSGRQDFVWKGEVNTSYGNAINAGKPIENGEFRIKAVAFDEKGSVLKDAGGEHALAIQTTVKARMTGSDFTNKTPKIVVGNNTLPLTSIVSIQAAKGVEAVNRYEVMKDLSETDKEELIKTIDEMKEKANKEQELEKKVNELSLEQYDNLTKIIANKETQGV